MNLTNLENGDWVKVKGVDFGTQGAKNFTAQVASATQGGNIELRLGALDGKLIGTCEVGNTGGAQSWKKLSTKVSPTTGVQDIYLKFTGKEGQLLNLDFWQFN